MPHLGHRKAEQVAWALCDFSKVQANRRTLARVRVLVSLWRGKKSRSPSWLSAIVQFSKDLTQKQVKGTHRHTDASGACPWPGPWPRAVAMRKCPVLFFSKLWHFCLHPRRDLVLVWTWTKSDFSGRWEFKMSLQHENGSGCMCSSKRQNSQATILKLGNKRRHLRFYRMYWWQLISKEDKNRPEFLILRNTDILGLIILCCEGPSSESDFEQHPGSPPTRCPAAPPFQARQSRWLWTLSNMLRGKTTPKWEPPK